MKVWKYLAAFLVAAGLSTSMYAQAIRATQGNIYGKVTDESGAVLPGVTVTLAGVGAARTVTTGAGGEFRFISIDPGAYTLKTELAGFATVNRENVTVSTGSNTDITIAMKISSVAATVTVTGEVPLLDPRKERTGSNFSSEQLKAIPTSRDPWGMLQLSASVLTDHVITGANQNGQQSVFIGKGTNFGNNAWNIDGIAITDLAAVGASPTYWDFGAFQEMQFATGGPDPSITAPGVTLNMITKRGTNNPHGSARIFYTPNQTEAYNINPEAADEGVVQNRIVNIQDYGVEVGGPAWKDYIWLWGAFGYTDVKTTTATSVTPPATRQNVGNRDDTQLTDYNVKVNGQPIPSNSMTLFYFRGDKTKQGRGTSTRRPQETGWNQSGPSHFEKIDDSQVFSSNFFFSAAYSYQTTPFNLDPLGGDRTVYRDASQVWHNSYIVDHNNRPQHQVQGTGSFFFNTGSMGHEIKFGGTYVKFEQNHSRYWPGNGTYGDLRIIADHDPAYPYTANITRADFDGQQITALGYFLGDTLTWGPLTLNLGVRYDSGYGNNLASTAPANPAFPDLLGPLEYPGGGSDFRSARWEPRIGVTYALGSQRTTLLKASYSQFADQLGTSIVAVNNPLGAVARAQYQWNDANGDHLITRDELCLTCPVNPIGYDPNNPNASFSPNQIDPNLEAPLTDEVIGGIEHQILPELVAGVSYTYRKRHDFTWQCPIALDNSAACISNSDYALSNSGVTGYDNQGNPWVADPLYWVPNIPASYSYGVFETNRADYNTTYNGVEFQLNKRLSNKWMASANFTWSDWKSNISNVATGCIDPTNQTGSFVGTFQGAQGVADSCGNGHIAYDYNGVSWINASWAFSVTGLYQLPWDFSISGSVFGHEGYPIPYYNVEDPGDGLGQRTVAAGLPDAHRLKNVYEFDLSVQKVIPIAGTAEITLSINMFNVLNSNTILFRQSDTTWQGDDPPTGTAGSIDRVQNPRVLQFGARVSF
jgi:Carboxypeptidase regulatory-like domain